MYSPLVSALALAVSFPFLVSASPIDVSDLPAQNATEFALVRANKYGYPLVPFSKLALPILSDSSSNTFQHTKNLPTPDSTSVDFPNLNILSSTAIIDLAAANVIVNIPSIPDRFWVFAFYDIYGSNFANVGVVGGYAEGKYRISYRPGKPGIERGDGDYQGYVYSPTPYGVLVAQLQVKNAPDVDEVNLLQENMELSEVPIRTQLAPRLTKYLLDGGSSGNPTEELLQLTARLSFFNLPSVASEIPRVTAILQLAGCSQGSYATPWGVDLNRAAKVANSSVLGVPQSPEYFQDLQNGWQGPQSEWQGKYKTFYLARAWSAHVNYLALDANQALYPSYSDGNNKLSLEPNQAYKLTFESLPPLATSGFWSLTAYGANKGLVENSLNQYYVGSSTGLTSSDGKYEIFLQSEQPAIGASNWLPTPSGGGEVSFALRIYGPGDGLKDGSWSYPVVEKVDATTGLSLPSTIAGGQQVLDHARFLEL
ncbi:hypothetical protein N7466_003549 [Penicillium verhagenii]|uniref:uncharacterized protein n=1 Tax=Penicillium verhagenii TaxID=1562060 RepID=UPI002545ADE3|nr:uncharacterized protein N7466_003549 [Penicillium verhagenii]KAJ5937099.1 hypothetical protein N7466_003549 [Penicillium verhagenii]